MSDGEQVQVEAPETLNEEPSEAVENNSNEQPEENGAGFEAEAQPNGDSEEGGAMKRSYEEEDQQASHDGQSAEPPAKRHHTSEGEGQEGQQGQNGSEGQNASEVHKVIMVPSNLAGYIIGSKGETIRRLEAKCGARIKVAQAGTGNEREVTISGTAEGVDHGVQLVNEVVETERERSKARGDDDKAIKDRIEFLCPRGRVGLIIGRGGEKIKDLQEKSGARIQVVQDNLPPYAEGKPVLLTGTREAVESARQMIKDVIGDGFIMPSNYSLTLFNNEDGSIDMEVPAGTVGLIVGRNGDTIKNIQNESGAKVEMERDNNTPMRSVKITGEPESVRRAQEKIVSIVIEARRRDEQNGRGYGANLPMITETHAFPISSKVVGLVIGKGGETIHSIQDKTGAKIQLEQNVPQGAPEKKFMITGTFDQIEHAKRMIWDRVGEQGPMPMSFRVGGGGGMGGPGFGGPQGMRGGPPQQFGGYPPRQGQGFNQGGYGGPQQQRPQQFGQWNQGGPGYGEGQQQQGQWGNQQAGQQGQWGQQQGQWGGQQQQQQQHGQWGQQAQGQGEAKKDGQEYNAQWASAWQQYYQQGGQQQQGQQPGQAQAGQAAVAGAQGQQGQGGQGGDYSQQWAAYYQQYYNQNPQAGQAGQQQQGQQQGQQQWTPEQIQQWYASQGQQAPK